MAIYEDLRKNRLTTMETIKAVNDQKKVGALGASLKVNPEVKSAFKEWTTDDHIDKKSEIIEGSQETYSDPDGTLAEGGRIERGENEWGSKGQPKASEQLKVGQSKWSQLDTAGKIAAGGEVLSQALMTIDMLTGGQDTILAGSGHTYSSGYNPEMYIGRTV